MDIESRGNRKFESQVSLNNPGCSNSFSLIDSSKATAGGAKALTGTTDNQYVWIRIT